jgi:hypothetical protein
MMGRDHIGDEVGVSFAIVMCQPGESGGKFMTELFPLGGMEPLPVPDFARMLSGAFSSAAVRSIVWNASRLLPTSCHLAAVSSDSLLVAKRIW